MVDREAYRPDKSYWRQGWEVFGAALVIIVVVCMVLYWMTSIPASATATPTLENSKMEIGSDER